MGDDDQTHGTILATGSASNSEENRMNTRRQRLIAFALAAALAAPLSLAAETRRTQRTDLRQLAADLSRVLGNDNVQLNGSPVDDRDDAAPSEIASIVDAMNRERAARGLTPLRINRRLTLAANDRVGDMLSKHYFDHVSPEGMSPFKWVEREGYAYHEVGENLAIGYRSDAVVDGWMRSPGHRANILGAGYDEVGVAVAPESPMRGYAAPLVVALYGSR